MKIVSRRHNPVKEVTILQSCQGHPNIVHLHEVIQDKVMSLFLSLFLSNSLLLTLTQILSFFSSMYT